MKTHLFMKLVVGAAAVLPVAFLSSCVATSAPSPELVTAREALTRAKDGPAARLDPTDIHEAEVALGKAEKAFSDDPGSQLTDDLAVIAALKAFAAEAVAGTLSANAAQASAQVDLRTAEADKLRAANGNLAVARGNLSQTRDQLEHQRSESDAERTGRLRAEAQLKDARDTLARIASVKNDDRGLVVTFQGESLFVTGKSALLPAAMVKLDQVAETLRGRERKIHVLGFTDSQGGVGQYNQDLSERRAAAVRDYLVGKGIPADLINAEGRGASQFVAENGTIEGRAANRRVEIIVEPNAHSTQ